MSISTTGGLVIGMTKPLMPLFPVSGDDPAVIGFYLGNIGEKFVTARAPSPAREAHALPGKSALAGTLFNMRGIMKFIAHRIAGYVRA